MSEVSLRAGGGAFRAGTDRAAARGSVHPLMVITILALLIPITWNIGTLYMTPMRFLYMFTVPALLIIWARGGMGKPLIGDWLLFGYIFWMAISVAKNHPSQLVTFTGSTGLTILGGYLTARYTIRSVSDFMALTRLLAGVVILVLLPLGLYEALGKSGSLALKFLSGLPFFDTYKEVEYCCRLGLDRAQSVFVHPIHHGVACTIPFALYFTGLTNHVSLFKRIVVAALIGVAAFTSVSSGAVLAAGFMGMLMLYTMVLHKNPDQWRMFMWSALAVYVLLEVNSTKFAFMALAEKLAFDPWNVYIRGLLYNAGIEQVMKTPILGFGYNRLPALPRWMTGSMDNYWLQQAVSHGILGFVLPFATFLYAILRAGRNGFTKGSDLYYVRLGYGFALTGLVLSMTTVAVWAEVQSLIFLALGMGQFLFYAREPDEAAEPVAPPPRRPAGPAYTRFPEGRSPDPGARPATRTVARRHDMAGPTRA